jgi:hypothetical protein
MKERESRSGEMRLLKLVAVVCLSSSSFRRYFVSAPIRLILVMVTMARPTMHPDATSFLL